MNRMMFLLVFFLQPLVSCNKGLENGSLESEISVVIDGNLADQLRSSPKNVVINSNNLSLDTYLWRDFMPPAEENGSPLMCVIKFIGQTNSVLFNSVSLSKLYVVNHNKIWISDTFETHIFHEDNWEVVIRNGPKWEPGIYVDVICEFMSQGQSFKLIAKSQMINATH